MKATATRPAPALDDERPREPQPTRIAVFGSVAAERPLDGGEPGTPAPVRAVLERVLESIAGRAPAIAEPILDRAVADGRITRFERHALLRELGHPDGVGGGAAASVPARQVLREVLAAVRRAAPAIAQPILDEALVSERLTAAQHQRVLDRLRTSPAGALGRRPARNGAGGMSPAA